MALRKKHNPFLKSNDDTGFNSNSSNYGGRFVNKDGTFNVKKEDIPFWGKIQHVSYHANIANMEIHKHHRYFFHIHKPHIYLYFLDSRRIRHHRNDNKKEPGISSAKCFSLARRHSVLLVTEELILLVVWLTFSLLQTH